MSAPLNTTMSRQFATALPAEDVPVPAQVARLPRDRHGRVVPWFVHIKDDGQPDHRVGRDGALRDALRFDLCWMCGGARGRYGSFVLGPMCIINRTTAEPPCHLECAVYAARVCPFLTTPRMRRRDTGLPEGTVVPGVMIERNPGVVAVWTTRDWTTKTPPNGGILFDLDPLPAALLWFSEGRSAHRSEALAAIDSGLPILLAHTDGDLDAAADIQQEYQRILSLLPDENGTMPPLPTPTRARGTRRP